MTQTSTEDYNIYATYVARLGKELFFILLGGLLFLGEVEIIDGRELDVRDIDLGGGGHDESLVDTAKRDTVDLEGA